MSEESIQADSAPSHQLNSLVFLAYLDAEEKIASELDVKHLNHHFDLIADASHPSGGIFFVQAFRD